MKQRKKTGLVLIALLTLIALPLSLFGCATQPAEPIKAPETDTQTTDTASLLSGTSGILSVDINESGELIVTYTDGSQENLGKIVGSDGKDGVDGKDGIDGVDGKDGKDGKDGVDGKDGTNGSQGAPGKDGKDGADGKDGTLVIQGESASISAAAALAIRSTVCIVSKYTSSDLEAGSGIIYSLDSATGSALVITNYHVIYSAKNRCVSNDISLYLYGSYLMEGQSIPATFVGGSFEDEIAVLQVKNSDILKQSSARAATVADSNKVRLGDTAIAIGNPMAEGFSVTSGTVSIDSENLILLGADDYRAITLTVMRIDTPVNNGNSGGGLFNERGELIGIVTAKSIKDQVDNVGYAIPSRIAIAMADNLIDNCLGTASISLKEYTLGIECIRADAKSVYDSTDGSVSIVETIEVSTVSAGGPCQGILRVGDVITAVTCNGKTTEITRIHQLIPFVLEIRVNDVVSFTVLRNGNEMTLTLPTNASYFS